MFQNGAKKWRILNTIWFGSQSENDEILNRSSFFISHWRNVVLSAFPFKKHPVNDLSPITKFVTLIL